MTDIKWQQPPSSNGSGNRSHEWKAIADALRARPGEWALVRTATHYTAASQIKSGSLVAFQPRGSFESTAAKRDDGKIDIYARYVGGALS